MGEPLEEVLMERARQDGKWGLQNHDDVGWLLILMEEVGEIADALRCSVALPAEVASVVLDIIRTGDRAQDVIQDDLAYQWETTNGGKRVEAETVQACAVSLAWLECRTRRLAAARAEEKEE